MRQLGEFHPLRTSGDTRAARPRSGSRIVGTGAARARCGPGSRPRRDGPRARRTARAPGRPFAPRGPCPARRARRPRDRLFHPAIRADNTMVKRWSAAPCKHGCPIVWRNVRVLRLPRALGLREDAAPRALRPDRAARGAAGSQLAECRPCAERDAPGVNDAAAQRG